MNTVKYEHQDFYHYTSIEALKNIVENRSLRFTDYRFLNDPKELIFGYDMFLEALNSSDQTKDFKKFIEIVNKMKSYRSFTPVIEGNGEKGFLHKGYIESDFNFYGFSLSMNCDALSLWERYSKSGVSIKFNSQKLFEFVHQIRDNNYQHGLLNVIRGKVEYGKKPLDFLLFSPESFQIISKLGEDQMILNSKSQVLTYTSLVKDSCWKDEEEYKIGIPLEFSLLNKLISSNDAKIVHVLKDSVIKPQIEFRNFPIESIESVVISPYLKSEETVFSLENFLKFYGLNDVKVSKSCIDLR